MADVQLEHGHIRIANSLWRALELAKLSNVSRRVLMECLGRQYGWTRPRESPTPFSASPASVSRAVGCARETASRSLHQLARRRILVRRGDHLYSVEKDYDRWRCGFHGDPDFVPWTPRGDCDEMITPRDEMITPTVTRRSRHRDEMITPSTTQARVATAESGPLEPVRTILEPEQRTRARRWTVFELREHLGGKGLEPPAIQAPRWHGILAQTDDEIDEALKLSGGKAHPLSYFLALFDAEGKRKAGRTKRDTIQDEPERRRFVVPDKWGRGLAGGGLWSRLIRAWPEDARREYVSRCEGGESKGEVFVDLNDRHPEHRA